MNHKGCKSKQISKELGYKKYLNCRMCLEHGTHFCRCGYEFGNHDITVKYKPKENCVVCGDYLDTDFYDKRGNFCEECIRRVNLVVGEFITQEQADEQIKTAR